MGSEFYSIRELLSVTLDGDWGFDPLAPSGETTEMRVIRGTDFDAVQRGAINTVPIRAIRSHIANRKVLQNGDVLIETAGGSAKRSTGRVCLITKAILEKSDRPVTCASFARFLRFDPLKIDPEFAYWSLQSLYCAGVMAQNQVQHTGIARFQFTKFAETQLLAVPPIEDQLRVSSLLQALDSRILSLTILNETLEAIARAIFKSWFVDFDPVRAKAEGREPEGMDADTAALFPSEFQGPVFGQIPEGWIACSIDSIATFLNGVALQKYPAREGEEWLPAIKIAQLKRGSADGADKVSSSIPQKFLVRDGDLLFSWSGSLEVEFWTGGNGALNQHLFKVSSELFPQWFVYLWLKQHLSRFQEIAESKVTTMGHIQRHHLSEAIVVVPPPKTLIALDRFVGPLIEKVVSGRLLARTLAELRDTILPRLISGKLRVPEAEKLVEAVL